MIRDQSDHDPTMIRPHPRPSRNRRAAEVDHRRSWTHFVLKNIGFRASAISQKRISCETSSKTLSATPPPAPLAMLFTLREGSYSCKSQWNSIGNSSSSTTCDPIYIAGKILQLQITMEFCRPHTHEKQLKPHLQCGTDPTMIRNQSDHDPTMIRPHPRPSRNRRAAEVDHRGLGTDFVWKNIGFRASAIKVISLEWGSQNEWGSQLLGCAPLPHMHGKTTNHHAALLHFTTGVRNHHAALLNFTTGVWGTSCLSVKRLSIIKVVY